MDRDAFDGLARFLAASPSRRQALAALLGAVMPGAAEGRGGARKKGCKGEKKRCGKKCCRPDQRCQNGACIDVVGRSCPRAQKASVEACLEDGVDAWIALIEPCRDACVADSASAVCADCLQPAIDTALEDVEACALYCFSGGDASNRTARAGRLRLDAPACDQARLDTCLARVDRDNKVRFGATFLKCLSSFGVGCAIDAMERSTLASFARADCMADFGCPSLGPCAANKCVGSTCQASGGCAAGQSCSATTIPRPGGGFKSIWGCKCDPVQCTNTVGGSSNQGCNSAHSACPCHGGAECCNGCCCAEAGMFCHKGLKCCPSGVETCGDECCLEDEYCCNAGVSRCCPGDHDCDDTGCIAPGE